MPDAANFVLAGAAILALLRKKKPAAPVSGGSDLQRLLAAVGAPPPPSGAYIWGAMQHDTNRPVLMTNTGDEVELDPSLTVWLAYDPAGNPLAVWDGTTWRS